MLLEDVSLTIPAGKRIGLIGADEMEKHALVYLIPRLLDPTVRRDPHRPAQPALGDAGLAAHPDRHASCSTTWSSTTRWPTTSAAATRPTRCRKIIEAAKMAHAHHFIQKLPQGYETPIGELGHSLT